LRKLLFLLILCFPLLAFANSQAIFVQLRFSVDTPQGTFTDAIYYTQAEYAASTPAQRNAEMAARVQAWRQAILNPPTPPTPSVDDLQRSIDEIDETREQFLLRRQALLAACRARGGCQ
jgi:hypothetical protein